MRAFTAVESNVLYKVAEPTFDAMKIAIFVKKVLMATCVPTPFNRIVTTVSNSKLLCTWTAHNEFNFPSFEARFHSIYVLNLITIIIILIIIGLEYGPRKSIKLEPALKAEDSGQTGGHWNRSMSGVTKSNERKCPRVNAHHWSS